MYSPARLAVRRLPNRGTSANPSTGSAAQRVRKLWAAVFAKAPRPAATKVPKKANEQMKK